MILKNHGTHLLNFNQCTSWIASKDGATICHAVCPKKTRFKKQH